jgi:flagellar hook-length control protein FliK
VTNSLSGNEGGSSLIPIIQGVKGGFVDVLNGLALPQEAEVMKSASLDEWNNLLKNNPVLREQFEKNPELADQIKALFEGQALSKEGDVLPPLLAEGGGEGLTEGFVTSSELKTSDAASTLQQVIDGFLSEQQPSELDGSEGVQNFELTNMSTPYILTEQNDSNLKSWVGLSNSGQAFNTPAGQTPNAGGQMLNSTGMLNGEYSVSTFTTIDKGGSNPNLMQGVVAIGGLQSETDAQFKASFESFSSLDSKAGDLLESGRTLERVDSSRSQFSEIQSKLNGAGLKQYSTSLETNVQDPEWGDEMGQKIVWLTGRAIQSAEIHLNPADLGPIEVQIKVQNDQTAVTFHAQNSTVRDMLESNVHRLRDMMESNGVDLAEVSVGSDESGDQYAAKDGDGNESGQNGGGDSSSQNDLLGESSDELAQTSSISNRIVDFYA